VTPSKEELANYKAFTEAFITDMARRNLEFCDPRREDLETTGESPWGSDMNQPPKLSLAATVDLRVKPNQTWPEIRLHNWYWLTPDQKEEFDSRFISMRDQVWHKVALHNLEGIDPWHQKYDRSVGDLVVKWLEELADAERASPSNARI
jgi:hypothetical protein